MKTRPTLYEQNKYKYVRCDCAINFKKINRMKTDCVLFNNEEGIIYFRFRIAMDYTIQQLYGDIL